MKNTNDNSFFFLEMGDMIFEKFSQRNIYTSTFMCIILGVMKQGEAQRFCALLLHRHSDGVLYTFLYSD